MAKSRIVFCPDRVRALRKNTMPTFFVGVEDVGDMHLTAMVMEAATRLRETTVITMGAAAGQAQGEVFYGLAESLHKQGKSPVLLGEHRKEFVQPNWIDAMWERYAAVTVGPAVFLWLGKDDGTGEALEYRIRTVPEGAQAFEELVAIFGMGLFPHLGRNYLLRTFSA